MSKVSKELHQCKKCGRLSSAKSVLRESKDKKGVISYHCTNSVKCKEDQKAGLVNGQRKIVRMKKATPVKKGAKKK